MMVEKIQTLYIYTTEKRSIFILCSLLIGFLFLYIAFIGIIAATVASHDTIQGKIQALNSSVGELESEYRVLTKNITKEEALALGFKKPKKEVFAFRKRLVQNDINAF